MAFGFKIHQKPFSAGVPPRTPLGSLWRSQDPYSRMGPYPSPRLLRRLDLAASVLVYHFLTPSAAADGKGLTF